MDLFYWIVAAIQLSIGHDTKIRLYFSGTGHNTVCVNTTCILQRQRVSIGNIIIIAMNI